MKTQHTPGPWRAKRAAVYAGNDAIAFTADPLEQDDASDEDIANAALIAAAPELLAALEDLRCQLETADFRGNYHAVSLDEANAAIAKAKGGQG